MKRYVLGFAFNLEGDEVVLIRKNQPAWQAGRFNGVGGKINEHEEPVAAMVREFEEETGVKTTQQDWCWTVSVTFVDAEMYVFACRTADIAKVRSTTAERVVVLNVQSALENRLLIPNLRYLIPLSLDQFLTKPIYMTEF